MAMAEGRSVYTGQDLSVLRCTSFVWIVDGHNRSNGVNILPRETVFDRSCDHKVLVPKVRCEVRPRCIRARNIGRRRDQSTRRFNLNDFLHVATTQALGAIKSMFLGGVKVIDGTPDDICNNPSGKRVALAGAVSKADLVKPQDVCPQLCDRNNGRRRRPFTKPSRTQVRAVCEVHHRIPHTSMRKVTSRWPSREPTSSAMGFWSDQRDYMALVTCGGFRPRSRTNRTRFGIG